MPLIASDSGEQNFPPTPEGLHAGVCCGIWDLGTHYETGGTWQKDVHKVLFQWELPALRIDVEKNGMAENLPRVISQRFTLSLHTKANMRKLLESWRGRAFTKEELKKFDLVNCLGKSCKIQVIHNDKGERTYANVNLVIKHDEQITPENTPKFYSIEDHGIHLPEDTPQWIQDEIKTSHEYNELINPREQGEEPERLDEGPPPEDDDIPF